ncbi:MAG: hypothetical protein LBV47_01095 [Bacteroidales bacterium]|jgi:hypothetical protein|nr:hypothetical protein [Bacteroidales bacterium]
MKKFMKFFGIAVFAAVLFANVSIKANKSTGDALLTEIVSEANAACEMPTAPMFPMHCVYGYDFCVGGPGPIDCEDPDF